jgi:hypothetical protein
MSARPPFDQREPFDPDEAEIARAYRALPGGEPSPALDARILAQARSAVATRKRRPRPWFMGAGFGAAAAAVMAAGMAWQLGWIGGIPGASMTVPQERRQDEAGAAKPAARRQESVERIEIEYYKVEEKAAQSMPEEAAAAPPARSRKIAPSTPAPATATPPAPPAPQPLQDAAPPPPPAAPAPEPFPAESRSAPATVGGASARSEEFRREARDDDELDRINVTGSRLAKQRSALPPWVEDVQLEPDAWLDRIRERVREGDRQSAENSLRRFVLAHPQRTVPRELQRLLVE